MNEYLKTASIIIGIVAVVGGLVYSEVTRRADIDHDRKLNAEIHAKVLKFMEAQVELNTAQRIEREVRERLERERHKDE